MGQISPVRGIVGRLEAKAAQKPSLRTLGKTLKYVSPLITSGLLAALYLTGPGAATLGGLIFYALLGGAVGTWASRGIAKSFKIAGLKREKEEAENELEEVKNELKGLREGAGISDSVSFDGRHVLIGELGQGGMATALQVFDTKLRVFKVFKVPLPSLLGDSEALRRFTGAEAKAMVELDHPGVVRFFSLFEIDHNLYQSLTGISLAQKSNIPPKIPCIEMEYVKHPTLQKRIEQLRAQGYTGFSLEWVLEIGIAAAETLRYVHKKNIVHRDLKPDNIFVVPDENHPGKETVKIADFGLARSNLSASSRLTQAGSVFGTPEYMSPEQWSGVPNKIDWKTDQYALGVILYELLAGEPPYGYLGEGNQMAYAMKVCDQKVPVPDIRNKVNVSDEVWRVLQKMLAKNQNQRYQSWEEIITDLKNLDPTRVLAYEPTAVAEIGPDGRPKKKF